MFAPSSLFGSRRQASRGLDARRLLRLAAPALALASLLACDVGSGPHERAVTGAPGAGLTGPSRTSTGFVPDFAAVVAGVRPRGFGATPYTLQQPAAGGRVWYVDPAGSDSADGTPAHPLRTINGAAQRAVAGDVVTIRPGTYDEDVRVKNSGAPGLPIVFQAEQIGTVTLTGGTHTFQPRFWTGGAEPRGQWYITVRGLIFSHYSDPLSEENAIAAVRATKGWIIEDDLFDEAGKTGLEIRDNDVLVQRSTFRRNYINAIVAWGETEGAETPADPRFKPITGTVLRDLIVTENNITPLPLTDSIAEYVVKILGTSGTLVDNVESAYNYGNGIWFDTRNVDYVVRNSYLHDNRPVAGVSTRGRGLFLEVSWPTGLVENNVFRNNRGAGVTVSSSSGIEVRYNLMQGNQQCVSFINSFRGSNADGALRYPLKDVYVHDNWCQDWKGQAGVQTLGGTFHELPSAWNVMFDWNVYTPVNGIGLAQWPRVGTLTTLEAVQSRLGWELHGALGPAGAP